MGTSKMKRFAENFARYNVVEIGKPTFKNLVGKWASEQFKNELPITLEIACGKGEYTIGLGEKFRDRNFIGIDIKGSRIWKGSGLGIEKDLDNVAFLRAHVYMITDHFAEDEVSEIWITFPDPFLDQEKRRVTHKLYLDLYKKILKNNGLVHLKTDNTKLFRFTLGEMERTGFELLRCTENLYESEYYDECLQIKTYYEEKFTALGEDIKYACWRNKIDVIENGT